jgi:hypothetical protein
MKPSEATLVELYNSNFIYENHKTEVSLEEQIAEWYDEFRYAAHEHKDGNFGFYESY